MMHQGLLKKFYELLSKMRFHHDSEDSIILCRRHLQTLLEYAENNESLRDYLVVRIPAYTGMRTREIALSRVEDWDFKNLTVQVLDSKKHVFRMVPTDIKTAMRVQQLAEQEGIAEGVLIRRRKRGAARRADKPLSSRMLDCICHRMAHAAGLPHPEQVTPRVFRHYFAAIYIERDGKKHCLQQWLGHQNPSTTDVYLSRLFFFEDGQEDYNRVFNRCRVQTPNGNEVFRKMEKNLGEFGGGKERRRK